MHEAEWDGTKYTLYSPRLEPRGPDALPPRVPKDEYSLKNVFGKEAKIFAEYKGLYGFIAKSTYQGLFPNTNSLGKEVDYQGSRQLDNFSRRYYEKELGAAAGPSPGGSQMFGYTEPFRRFVQHETFSPQANEIPNTAASWLPGDDYYTNFHEGDPFIKVDDGYARLPGAGYAALHPELENVDPENYPDIHKMAILADVAPYSREYNQVETSFSPFCHLRKPLPPSGIFFTIFMYMHYLHATCAGDSEFLPRHRSGQLHGSRSKLRQPIPKLRHMNPAGSKLRQLSSG